MSSQPAKRVSLPVEWWAPTVSGVAMVAVAGFVVSVVMLPPRGEFGGMMLLAFLFGFAAYAVVSALTILVVDLALAGVRDGVVPTGAYAFLGAVGASILPLLVLFGMKDASLAWTVLTLLLAPLPFRCWRSRAAR